MSARVVGIDPGLSGAIAEIDRATRRVIVVHAMPTAMTAGGDRVVCEVGLWRLVESLRTHLFVVEKVTCFSSKNPREKISAKSMFNFGNGFGKIEAVLEAAGVRRTYVEPTIWKRGLGIASAKTRPIRKALAIQRANQLFPGQGEEWWPNKSDDGKAEAALIAYWGADNA